MKIGDRFRPSGNVARSNLSKLTWWPRIHLRPLLLSTIKNIIRIDCHVLCGFFSSCACCYRHWLMVRCSVKLPSMHVKKQESANGNLSFAIIMTFGAHATCHRDARRNCGCRIWRRADHRYKSIDWTLINVIRSVVRHKSKISLALVGMSVIIMLQ